MKKDEKEDVIIDYKIRWWIAAIFSTLMILVSVVFLTTIICNSHYDFLIEAIMLLLISSWVSFWSIRKVIRWKKEK